MYMVRCNFSIGRSHHIYTGQCHLFSRERQQLGESRRLPRANQMRAVIDEAIIRDLHHN